MTEVAWGEALAALIDAHVAGERPSTDHLDETHAKDASELLDVADLLWEAAHGAPALHDDPVAAMLGLIPDPARSLDRRALRRAMGASGLSASVLAERLASRGWTVVTRDVFNWQTRDDVAVPPALIQAIAEVTRVAPEALIVDRGDSPAHRALASMTSSQRFRQMAERWAELRGTSSSLAASALESRLATSVYRGGEPDEEQMLASLQTLITALESEAGDDRAD